MSTLDRAPKSGTSRTFFQISLGRTLKSFLTGSKENSTNSSTVLKVRRLKRCSRTRHCISLASVSAVIADLDQTPSIPTYPWVPILPLCKTYQTKISLTSKPNSHPLTTRCSLSREWRISHVWQDLLTFSVERPRQWSKVGIVAGRTEPSSDPAVDLKPQPG